MTINPLTYANSTSASAPHGVGTIFGTMLWDLAWRLVQREGASGDLLYGDGGENRMLRLVLQALKLQPCNAGLVDARNALLAADQMLYGGAYQCDIWRTFARRGLGASANQGSASILADNVAAFDVYGPCERIFANGFQSPQPTTSQFCSTIGAIDLPGGQPGTTFGPASAYPVPINVHGLANAPSAVRVQMFGLTHTFPDDLDLLLVSPDHRNLVIQSDVGGGTDAINLSYVIDDAAPTLLPDAGPLTAGSFRPSNVGAGDPFAVPAPVGPHNNAAPAGSATLGSVFGSSQPNGSWRLYIVDDAAGDVGTLSGVCLEIDHLP
ncbi:MAG: M36 family metallopeptidase [Xanthomonadales bacterium]|nr:M36 family metallopeptidase [Xanthomonadales bacterium]